MFTLRIDSGIGWGGYRATVYGPGLPTGEPKRARLDLPRALSELRKLPPFWALITDKILTARGDATP